jgi:RimJ/RimL family protein N-acetyltransferase
MPSDVGVSIFPAVEVPFRGGRLTAWREDDVPMVVAAVNDPQTHRWLPLPSPYTDDHARYWTSTLSEQLRVSGDGLHLAARAADGALVGSVSLKRTDRAARVTEIGYWTVPQMRGRGLTTAAVRALAEWALTEGGMRRVEIRVAPGNAASRQVAKKAGFTEEGTLRDAGFVHDGRVDLVVSSLVVDDLAS